MFLLPDIYLNIGKKDFSKKDYISAYKSLRFANSLNAKNREVRYYFAKTLINLKPTLEVQQELYKLSESKSSDSAALLADMQIQKWKELVLSKVGENYIEQVPLNDQVLRWDVNTFPLKVCIKNEAVNPLPDYYVNEIQKAFSQWQKSTSDFMRFKFVDDLEEPQIIVKITTNNQTKNCTEKECQYIAAFTAPTIKDDMLQNMTITLYDLAGNNRPFSPKQLYNIVLHEIGHSLGIMGHSYNKNDLMYMEQDQDNDMSSNTSDFRFISSADVNTLKLLYMLIPDITNTPKEKFSTKGQIFAPIIMGSEEEMTSRKILEAQNYIKSAPELPNGYILLSAAYSEEQEYSKAVEALNKALELSSTDNDRFVVYYNFAVLYMNIQDWQNALRYAEMAKQIKTDSTSDIDGLIAAINFNKGNKAFAKQAYIKSLDKNPGKTIDAINLARIYLKEFNFIAAGRTLNNLVQANPEAKNDPVIRRYRILMFFFRQ